MKKSLTSLISILVTAGHSPDRWVVRGIAIGGIQLIFFLERWLIYVSNLLYHHSAWICPKDGRVSHECMDLPSCPGRCSRLCPDTDAH